jgi:hypothetical protein
MNSPAGNAGAQANWKAVLWHEYAHVVTLGLSKNKMPRWFSEGISVWEESRHDPAWGQRLTPRFQEMIRQGELLPVGQLSKAFISPKDGEHLMFAYYQSALVVEHLVERYGFAALTAVLRDLGEGVEMNRALEARAAPLPELEKTFQAFARQRAKQPPADAEALAAAVSEAHKRGHADDERRALMDLVRVAPDRGTAWDRLIELAGDAGALEQAARGLVAVNPMAAAGWRGLGRALEARADKDAAAAKEAAGAYDKVLLLEPPDPADVHLRLARLLRVSNPRLAKRHVLDALAEAPRFRDAHKLLLQLEGAPR